VSETSAPWLLQHAFGVEETLAACNWAPLPLPSMTGLYSDRSERSSMKRLIALSCRCSCVYVQALFAQGREP
jgi:hypothetical protein